MKKFLSLFGLLLPFAAFSQNGANEVLTAPSTTIPYILVDTLFTLDNYPATYTDVYIHFANPTVDDIKAVQFRLFYDDTNVLRVQITFANGFSDEYTPNEIDALYAAYHVADADGTLNGLSVIDSDSLGGQIAQVTIYNGSGGATVVLKTDYVQL